MRKSPVQLLTLLCVAASGCALADAATLGAGEGASPAPAPHVVNAPATTPVQAQARPVDVRLWIDGDQDLFQRGDRVRLRFRTSQDAYVAILHIDSDGRLEVLFPYSPWDDHLVRGLRTHSLPSSDWNSYWRISGSSGMGFFFIVASTEPLDFRPFQFGSRWDLSAVGTHVRGDPFWALDQLARMLVPDWRYASYGVDHYSYYVGRRIAYPGFACYERDGWWERSYWDAYYGSCDRVLLLLRSYPGYYDTRRYRGDRFGYWRELERTQPLHGFKERADQPEVRRGGTPLRTAPPARLQGTGTPRLRPQAGEPRGTPERPPQERTEPVRPERQRPVLERRPPPEESRERTRERQPQPSQERPPQPARERPAQERPAPQRTEPRRDPPAPRERPREQPRPRETPPDREAMAASIVRQAPA